MLPFSLFLAMKAINIHYRRIIKHRDAQRMTEIHICTTLMGNSGTLLFFFLMVFYFWNVCVCVCVCVCMCVSVYTFKKMMRKNRLHLWWSGLRRNTARETFLATGISGWPLEVMELMLSCVVLALMLQHPQTRSIFTLTSAKSLYIMPSLSHILAGREEKEAL